MSMSLWPRRKPAAFDIQLARARRVLAELRQAATAARQAAAKAKQAAGEQYNTANALATEDDNDA